MREDSALRPDMFLSLHRVQPASEKATEYVVFRNVKYAIKHTEPVCYPVMSTWEPLSSSYYVYLRNRAAWLVANLTKQTVPFARSYKVDVGAFPFVDMNPVIRIPATVKKNTEGKALVLAETGLTPQDPSRGTFTVTGKALEVFMMLKSRHIAWEEASDAVRGYYPLSVAHARAGKVVSQRLFAIASTMIYVESDKFSTAILGAVSDVEDSGDSTTIDVECVYKVKRVATSARHMGLRPCQAVATKCVGNYGFLIPFDCRGTTISMESAKTLISRLIGNTGHHDIATSYDFILDLVHKLFESNMIMHAQVREIVFLAIVIDIAEAVGGTPTYLYSRDDLAVLVGAFITVEVENNCSVALDGGKLLQAIIVDGDDLACLGFGDIDTRIRLELSHLLQQDVSLLCPREIAGLAESRVISDEQKQTFYSRFRALPQASAPWKVTAETAEMTIGFLVNGIDPDPRAYIDPTSVFSTDPVERAYSTYRNHAPNFGGVAASAVTVSRQTTGVLQIHKTVSDKKKAVKAMKTMLREKVIHNFVTIQSGNQYQLSGRISESMRNYVIEYNEKKKKATGSTLPPPEETSSRKRMRVEDECGF